PERAPVFARSMLAGRDDQGRIPHLVADRVPVSISKYQASPSLYDPEHIGPDEDQHERHAEKLSHGLPWDGHHGVEDGRLLFGTNHDLQARIEIRLREIDGPFPIRGHHDGG